jgi:hypothetical protein
MADKDMYECAPATVFNPLSKYMIFAYGLPALIDDFSNNYKSPVFNLAILFFDKYVLSGL